MGGEEGGPVARVAGEDGIAVGGHERCPPGAPLGGAGEDRHRRVEGVGEDLAEGRRLREPAGEDDLGARIALRGEDVAAVAEVEDRRQEHRPGDVPRRGVALVEPHHERRAAALHAHARLVIDKGEGEQAAAIVWRGKQERHEGLKSLAAGAGTGEAEHPHDGVHRRRAVADPDHVDRLAVGSAEVVDGAGDPLEGPIADRVGNDTRAEAHRYLSRGADERAGQRRRLIPFGGRKRRADRQPEEIGAMGIERAPILSRLGHLREESGEMREGAARLGGDEAVVRGEEFVIVIKRRLVDREHPGGIADPEAALPGQPEGDPTGGSGEMGGAAGEIGAVADRPEEAGGGDPLRHLDAKKRRELGRLGLVAAIAPQPRWRKRRSFSIGEHLAMHLTGDADCRHGQIDPLGGKILPQGRHRRAKRPLPVGGRLLVAFGPQTTHHLVARFAGAEDLQFAVGKDHRQPLRAGVDAEKPSRRWL